MACSRLQINFTVDGDPHTRALVHFKAGHEHPQLEEAPKLCCATHTNNSLVAHSSESCSGPNTMDTVVMAQHVSAFTN
jgi:hypothetical protein